METKQGKHKFGQREADALFDLMKTLSMSNTDKPVHYLDVIKTAHKEILNLRVESQANADTAMQYKQLWQDQCKRADDAELAQPAEQPPRGE